MLYKYETGQTIYTNYKGVYMKLVRNTVSQCKTLLVTNLAYFLCLPQPGSTVCTVAHP